MADVDPFVQPIPTEFQQSREIRAYFEYMHRWLHDMWVRTGAGTDEVARSASDSNRKADTLLYGVLNKVELGDPVTVDDTGFKADSTKLYTDITLS